jgi:sulfonate transport system permease protein
MIGYLKEPKGNPCLKHIQNLALSFLLPAVILFLWEICVSAGKINGNVAPPPTKLWDAFLKLAMSGRLSQGLIVSFRRVLSGFLIAGAIGVAIGFCMGLFRPFNRAMSSLVNVLRPIPTIALVPIFIIILGIGEAANVSIIVIGALWPVLLNTMAGVLSVNIKLMELAYVYRIGKIKAVFQIILPSALFNILTGLRLGIGGAWISVVAAEMIGATSGIGYMIMFAKSLAQAANMYVLVLIIGVIGFLIDKALMFFQNLVNKRFCARAE